jgi:transposase
MKKKSERFQSELDRINLEKSCYEMVYLQGLSVINVAKKYGLNRQTIYAYLHNFEAENPKVAEQMKKQGKNITPEDYKALQEEVARLRGELKHEKLRADFYEEMVKFGKEVYGIDLKKVGTK